MNFKAILENQPISASVPCRIDLGGTLDISTFFLPLAHLNPATFNISLNMRTTVTLLPWRDGRIKISSRGFESAEVDAERAPFRHPMGLMFAIVRYFNGHGVHVHIDSSSPPRSALGGSSAAAVAMIAAFQSALGHPVDPSKTATLAHVIESSVAGVPCGMQDQLAAAFGGVNLWYWKMGPDGVTFKRDALLDKFILDESIKPVEKQGTRRYEKHEDKIEDNIGTAPNQNILMNDNILIAYCGIPHVSSDINGRWVNTFLSGQDRDKWGRIIALTHEFVSALKRKNYAEAGSIMNQETRIRMEMTPDVLDDTGLQLFKVAEKSGCGARFTGAGGGGCLWAIGERDAMQALKSEWECVVEQNEAAQLLTATIDSKGIIIQN